MISTKPKSIKTHLSPVDDTKLFSGSPLNKNIFYRADSRVEESLFPPPSPDVFISADKATGIKRIRGTLRSDPQAHFPRQCSVRCARPFQVIWGSL
ncbi:hypothetical protein JTE90_023843 [Oedothorax gibbosus]|uniref:Uncharacterized protein n=1 Tax=Oedothorax gibbosus TaxID=931172 RepID=A0AAV6VHN6_9ARAC|nr:hypothetical protein JTE90_023843 [Oedothorax gibbosus]